MPSLGETIYIKKSQGTFDIDSFIKEEKKSIYITLFEWESKTKVVLIVSNLYLSH